MSHLCPNVYYYLCLTICSYFFIVIVRKHKFAYYVFLTVNKPFHYYQYTVHQLQKQAFKFECITFLLAFLMCPPFFECVHQSGSPIKKTYRTASGQRAVQTNKQTKKVSSQQQLWELKTMGESEIAWPQRTEEMHGKGTVGQKKQARSGWDEQ